jgi:hypothetical protein
MSRSTAAIGQESMMRNLVLLCSFLFVLCSGLRAGPVDTARRNGVAAQEALIRSRRVLHAYLERLDSVTGLLPRSGSQPAWFVRDSAADLYPFLVIEVSAWNEPPYGGTNK